MKSWLSDSSTGKFALVQAIVQAISDVGWSRSRVTVRLTTVGEAVTQKQLSNFVKNGCLHFRTFNNMLGCLPKEIVVRFCIHTLANLNCIDEFESLSRKLRSQTPKQWSPLAVKQSILDPSTPFFTHKHNQGYQQGVVFSSATLRLWLSLHFQISQANENRITKLDIEQGRIDLDGVSYAIPLLCYQEVLREPDVMSAESDVSEFTCV